MPVRSAHSLGEYSGSSLGQVRSLNRPVFYAGKRAFDILFSLALLPLLALAALTLLLANPLFNPGPLLFAQLRMGRGCKAFVTLKFRTMVPTDKLARGVNDPLEHDRIPKLGRILRTARIDELPQLINVLRGEMSLIGPRPDYFHHARRYLREVPGYRQRHLVRPGISGLAQTEVGYATGVEQTKAKVRADLHYIENAGPAMDSFVFIRTLITVFSRAGV